jgi:hypothetical protein
MESLFETITDNATTAAIVGASLTAAFGGVGYFILRFVNRDRSGLNASLRDVIQVEPLVSGQPSIGDQPVYCFSVQVLLALAHNQRGRRSLAVHRIAVELDSLSRNAAHAINCTKDVLGTAPRGVIDVRLYVVGLSSTSPWARYEVDRANSYRVSSKNLLEQEDRPKAVEIKPDAPATLLQIRLIAEDAGLTCARFAIHYGNQKNDVIKTAWIQIYKPP